MTVKYNRESLSMGDDAYNGVYRIEMPDDATLGELIHVLLHGGNGNDWPIPTTSVIGWVIYSDIGRLADVSADKKRIDYIVPEGSKLSALGVRWVYGAREGEEPAAAGLARLFEE